MSTISSARFPTGKVAVLTLLLTCLIALGQTPTPYKISQYPRVQSLGTNYLIILADPNVTNYSATIADLYRNIGTNLTGMDGALVLTSNSWYLATNQAAGTVGGVTNWPTSVSNLVSLASNYYVGTFTGDGDALTNIYDVYNVKSYGALGNGVADDAPAIRAALAAAAASATARGRIYIPAGTYMLASNDALTDQGVNPLIKLPSNIEIIGDPGRTILKVANTVTQWNGTMMTTDHGKTNIIIRNLIMDGNKAGRGLSASFYSSDNLIDLRATGECYLSDILAQNGAHAAYDFAWGTNIIGERLIARDCNGSGFTLTGSSQTLRDSISINCGHNQATADVDRRWGAGLQVAYEAKDILVDNFRSISNYTGANIIRAHGITIKNSEFIAGGTNYLIKVWLPTVIGTGAGTSHDINLENNRFHKVDGAEYGVWIQTGASSGTNKQVSVTKCDFENCQLLLDNCPEGVVANSTWQRFNSELIKGLVATNGTRMIATGNRFNWPGDFGITVYSGSNYISGNYFNNSYASIGILGNSNSVIGNVVQAPEATSFYSLYVSGSTNFIGMNYFEQAIRLVGSTAHGNTFMANVFPKVTDDSAAAMGNRWILNEVSSFDGTFAANNTNGHILTIKTNGFIGIGTNTPSSRVSVAGNVEVADDAYNATTWNGNGTVPTKNAIRDKIESLGSGSATNVYELTTTGTGLVLTTNGLLYTLGLNPALAALATNNGTGLTNLSGGGGVSTNAGALTNGSGAITASGHSMWLRDPNTSWITLNWTDQTLSTDGTNVLDWYNKYLIGNWTVTNGALSVVGPGPGAIDIADSAGGEQITLTVPSTVESNYTITLPSTNGITGNVLTLVNGVLSWSMPSSSYLVYPTNLAFAGHTNQFILANNYATLVASSDMAVTNVGGAVAGQYKWGTLRIRNSQSTNITVRTYSNAVAVIRIQGPSSTNALVIGPGKDGFLSYHVDDVLSTNLVTTTQQ